MLSLGTQAQAAVAPAAVTAATAPPSSPAPATAPDVGAGGADTASGCDDIADAVGEFIGEVLKGLLGG